MDSIRLQNRTTLDLGGGHIAAGLFLNAKQLFHPIFQVIDQKSEVIVSSTTWLRRAWKPVASPGSSPASRATSASNWVSKEPEYRPVVCAMKNHRAISSRNFDSGTPKSNRPISHRA